MSRLLWIGAVMIVGGLAGLRRGWRRQAADAGGCAAALALAFWQHRRVVPYVETVCKAPLADRAALVYLFAALYGLLHVLVSLYVPGRRSPGPRRWLSGLIGATQAGTLAALTLALLPRP